MKKVYIAVYPFGKFDSTPLNKLKHIFKVEINNKNKILSENELLKILKNDFVGVIAGLEKYSEKLLKNLPKLKVISRLGAGLDNIDIESAKKLNIKILNTPDTPTLAVAEFTVSLILGLLKKIFLLDKILKLKKWQQIPGNILSGKTIGIIGLGRIGKKLTELLKGFNLKILAYEPNPDYNFIKKHKIKLTDLEYLLSKSDIITLHLPFTPEVYHLISEREFEKMKDTAIIVNTSRGGIIDEDVLYKALKSRRIAAAAIDVFEEEPYYGKLRNLKNIIITPHCASFSIETRIEMEKKSVDNLINALK